MKAPINNQTNSNNNNEKQQASKSRKNRRGLYFAVFIFTAIVLLSRHETVKTIDCTPDIIAGKPDVIMLGAWWCTYCYQAKKYFQGNDIDYCEYDMESTVIGKQLYEENGSGAVPIFLIGNYRLQGFNPRQIERAIANLEKTP